MTRAVASIAIVAMMVGVPAMGGARGLEDPRVTTTRGDGRVTVTMAYRKLVVRETLSSSTFDVTVADPSDAVRFAGDASGRLRVERNGRVVVLAMTTATLTDAAAVKALLAGSSALATFDEAMRTEWAQTREATLFASAHATVGLLQGNTHRLRALVKRFRQDGEFRLIAAAQSGPAGCWDSYERDVIKYTYELEQCIQDAADSWNPFGVAWCAYEYNLKATLAFYWLLDCSGARG